MILVSPMINHCLRLYTLLRVKQMNTLMEAWLKLYMKSSYMQGKNLSWYQYCHIFKKWLNAH